MNGPDHYTQAEVAIGQALQQATRHGGDHDAARSLLTLAQVHATLALAAATALNDHADDGGGMPIADYHAWRNVAGLPHPTCSQCETEIPPGWTYCSTACRNLDDRHDNGSIDDVYSASELHEMDQADEAHLDAEDDAR